MCAVWRFASRVQLELRLEAEPRTSKLIQKIRRLKLLSAYWFFSMVFNFRCVFCGRGLGGVVDAGGVLVGRCWVWLTAVSATQRAGVEVAPSPAQNRRLSATKRLRGRRREL